MLSILLYFLTIINHVILQINYTYLIVLIISVNLFFMNIISKYPQLLYFLIAINCVALKINYAYLIAHIFIVNLFFINSIYKYPQPQLRSILVKSTHPRILGCKGFDTQTHTCTRNPYMNPCNIGHHNLRLSRNSQLKLTRFSSQVQIGHVQSIQVIVLMHSCFVRDGHENLSQLFLSLID